MWKMSEENKKLNLREKDEIPQEYILTKITEGDSDELIILKTMNKKLNGISTQLNWIGFSLVIMFGGVIYSLLLILKALKGQ